MPVDPGEGEPEDGDPDDGEPEDGEPDEGEPDEGEPEDGEPEDGEPEDGDPDDGEPDEGEPEDGEPDGDGVPPDELGVCDWLLQAPRAATTPRASSARTVVVLMTRSPDESAAARRPVVRNLSVLDTYLVAAPGAEVHSGALPSTLRVRPAAGRAKGRDGAAGPTPTGELNC